MTKNTSPRISLEEFENIVVILEARAKNFLRREARVGQSSRVSGHARILDDEWYTRLARLRDYMRDRIRETRQFMEKNPEVIDSASMLPVLIAAEREIGKERFTRLKNKNVSKRLMMLRDALDDALDLIDSEIARLGERIAPDCPLELLTAEEVETAFEEVPDAMLLARLLNLESGMRRTFDEIMALLTGRLYDTGGKRGGYEKRRGRWITAHLVGLAEGLGVLPTRNVSPQQHSQLQSAADVVAIVIGRLREELRIQARNVQEAENWHTDPASRAVFAELPKNRGEEFDPAAVAENIIRKVITPKQDYTEEARQIGYRIGQRDFQRRIFKSNVPTRHAAF